MQAAEAIKWITGIGTPLVNQVLFFNLKGNSLYEIELTPNPEAQKQRPSTLDEWLHTDYSVDCSSEIEISCMHIWHSLGRINVGEICLMVFTSGAHRREAIDACNEAVERIKAELPVWGRELLDNDMHRWKMNT